MRPRAIQNVPVSKGKDRQAQGDQLMGKASGQIVSGQVAAASQRVFSRTSEDAPAPIYTNAVEFTAMGIDVFMDVGVVTPEAIREAMSKEIGDAPPTVSFHVAFRFGMSIQTAATLAQRLSELLQQAQAQAQAQVQAQAQAQAQAQGRIEK